MVQAETNGINLKIYSVFSSFLNFIQTSWHL